MIFVVRTVPSCEDIFFLAVLDNHKGTFLSKNTFGLQYSMTSLVPKF